LLLAAEELNARNRSIGPDKGCKIDDDALRAVGAKIAHDEKAEGLGS
jgi:hypothetical protein